MKALIFDSSSIISLALNNLLFILEPLKKIFEGKFYITETIKGELVEKSLDNERFSLEALMIKKLLDEKILEVYKNRFEKEKVLNFANNTFFVDGSPIKLIHEGEASCVALYKFLEAEKKAIVIDERTTRMLCEAPRQLHQLLEKKLHKRVRTNEKNYRFFENINIIRSSELALIALEEGIIKLNASKEKIIRALLYALKFKGCSISKQEIEEIV